MEEMYKDLAKRIIGIVEKKIDTKGIPTKNVNLVIAQMIEYFFELEKSALTDEDFKKHHEKERMEDFNIIQKIINDEHITTDDKKKSVQKKLEVMGLSLFKEDEVEKIRKSFQMMNEDRN